MDRNRADIVLVARGYYPSRAKAREAIEASLVKVDGAVLAKPSALIGEAAQIEARQPYPWVSRGGVKLTAALDTFGIDPAGLTCLDIGASTGGFSHVLLESGAALVYAVDVGRGQLSPQLANREKLVSMEQCDARALTAEDFREPPDLAVFDVSFISLRLVFPNVLPLLADDAAIAALIKPQFEAGRERVAKGVVRDEATHHAVCNSIRTFLEAEGWRVTALVPSPIEGGEGNRGLLIGALRGNPAFAGGA